MFGPFLNLEQMMNNSAGYLSFKSVASHFLSCFLRPRRRNLRNLAAQLVESDLLALIELDLAYESKQ